MSCCLLPTVDMDREVLRQVEGGWKIFFIKQQFLPKERWLKSLFWMTDESCLSLKAAIDFMLYMLI